VTKYQKRISGPLLDRIDIHVEVPRVDYQKLSSDRSGESSEAIRERVEAARQIQSERFAKMKSTNVNSSTGASCAGVGGAGLMPARPRGGAAVL
jgi:magnesium chelatase family protein